MKILVIFTGRTIGCKAKRGFLSTDDSTNYALIDSFDPAGEEIEFSTASPYSVLSENLSANEINILQKEVLNSLNKGLDGIIVTHGTDSLLYSAAALEYAVGGCEIPVVLVSADYPLDDSRSNGQRNFEAAIAFIKSKAGNGVFVSYKNDDEEFTNIHVASHLLQHHECSANLYSIEGKPFAVCSERKISVKESLSNEEILPLGAVEYSDSSNILVVESHPGDSFCYSLEDVCAIILKPYHSATLNTSCQKFRSFCKMAEEKGIPVFLVNAKEGISYESTSLFSSLNIRVLPFGTFVSAYMKIWAALSLKEDLTVFLNKKIAREIIEP